MRERLMSGVDPSGDHYDRGRNTGSETLIPYLDADMLSSPVVNPHVGDAYFTDNIYERSRKASAEITARDNQNRCKLQYSHE